MVSKRAGWLVILFLGEMLTASAMGHFEHEIEKVVMLALFVPLIISSGGNSGSMIPIILKAFKQDPAVASAPFVATLVDVTGLVIYFNIAAVILKGTLL